MGWKRHAPEEIVDKLNRARTLLERGASIAEAARAIGVAEPTLFRWRRDFSGLRLHQIRRIKTLEAENARLRRVVEELDLSRAALESREHIHDAA